MGFEKEYWINFKKELSVSSSLVLWFYGSHYAKWFSMTTIIIYRKTQRIKKNILVTENQPENHTGAGKEIYNYSNIRLLIIIIII